MTGTDQPSVRSRAVFLIGGYERNDAAGFFKRVGRELGRFRTCWNVDVQMDSPVFDQHAQVATASISYRAADGACRSDLSFLCFDDVVKRDGARPFLLRFWAYIIAFLDYVVTGTMLRFFRANWRFALYFLYPMATLLALVWLGSVAFRLVIHLQFPGAWLVAMAAAVAVVFLGGRLLARRYFLFHLMDLWSFSREYLHGRRPEMDRRLDDWADLIASRLAAGSYDEVLLVGHSTGGALILDLAHQLADRLSRSGAKVDFHLLTVGSTSLKIALHPRAHRARERLQQLAGHPDIRWTEFQALTDIINFYKCDPFAAAGLKHQRKDLFPRQFQVRFKQMLAPDTYRRIKRNFFRVHYQFISANSREYFYDFFMICCGPRPLQTVAPGVEPDGAQQITIPHEVIG